jgi:ubiquinone/menaquinone biosynthesis C-methylase UbiE
MAGEESIMQEQMPNIWFRLMSLEYRLTSKANSVVRELEEAGVQPGMTVLDFGCGPGRYTLPAARMVGSKGTIYAVDVHPLALKAVEKKAKKEGLNNVQLIHSDCATGLASQSVDVVLLYDALHDVADKEAVLTELYRVLKPIGRISYKDHTLNGEPALSLMHSKGFFPIEQDLRAFFAHKMMVLGIGRDKLTSAPRRSRGE